MFSNSRNVQISGNPQLTYIDNRKNVNSEVLDNAMRVLLSRVVKGAMHNSGERFDAPTCHPDTRIALQDNILDWADKLVNDLNEVVTWLYGPAGAGKSAIAQTIAQKFHDRGQLTASFFFSRAAGGEGRGAETNLVATIAYQLSISVPATKTHIAATVWDNPLIFDLALQDQVTALIVAPLTAVSHRSSGTERPRIIVVDGLDECRKEQDAQKRVVDALIFGLRQIPHHTHKLFITSRPEHHIVSIFINHEAKILRRIELNDKWKPDDDIRAFLLSGFANILRSHPYFRIHPTDKAWPSLDIIETLVRKSSGQFIFASVALKYIKSEDNYDPDTRLEAILKIENNEDKPYAELDALYHYIFSQAKNIADVLAILSVERLHRSFAMKTDMPIPPLKRFLSRILGLSEGLISFRLRPLVSVMNVSFRKGLFLDYTHASLPDFLLDETRSGNFCINSVTVAMAVVSRVQKLFEDGTAWNLTFDNSSSQSRFSEFVVYLLKIPIYYEKILPSDQKFQVWTQLSINFMETVHCKPLIKFNSGLWQSLTTCIDWIFEESEVKHDTHATHCLSNIVADIQTWVATQFELTNIHHFENKHHTLWPFFIPNQRAMTVQQISRGFPVALEILGYPRQLGLEVSEHSLHQMAYLCSLIPDLQWVHQRSSLFGQYALKGERCLVAFQRAAYYVLQLPEHQLADVLKYRSFTTFEFSEDHPLSVLSHHDVLHKFLLRFSPHTADTGLLMALVYPMMVVLCDNFDVDIQQIIEKFPFLTKPTSEDYIQAGTKLKGMLIEAKIKTHLHKLSETLTSQRRRLEWLFEERLPYQHLLDTFAVIDIRASEQAVG